MGATSSFSILTNVPGLGSHVNFEETDLQVCINSIYYLCYKIYVLFIIRRGLDIVLLAEFLLARTEPHVWFLAQRSPERPVILAHMLEVVEMEDCPHLQSKFETKASQNSNNIINQSSYKK